jgi:parallel beta-helix repeat protein
MTKQLLSSLILLLILFFSTLVTGQSIIINELMAKNQDTIFDSDFHQSGDWIELYNAGLTNQSLSGYFLTDDPDDLQKWAVGNSDIAANSFKLFWADGFDKTLNEKHTNFKLSASGEWIALVAPNGAIVDSLGFKNQFEDVSYGREQDHLFNVGYLTHSTPNGANIGRVLQTGEQNMAPSIEPASGSYSATVTVVPENAEKGAIIRYTLDGSQPSVASPILSPTLMLNETTVFRARSFSETKLPSETVTRTFVIGAASDLPIASLVTTPRNLWSETDGIYVNKSIATRKEWERHGTLELFNLDDRNDFSIPVDYRLFGRSAIYLPQKSFAIFPDKMLDYPLFPGSDVNTFGSFILRSGSDDWDNMMCSDPMEQLLMSRHMNIEIQAYQPTVLYLNGEYFGIHNAREKYNEDYFKNKFDVAKENLDLLFVNFRNFSIEPTAGSAQDFLELLDYAESNDLSDASVYSYVISKIDLQNYLDYIVAQSYVGNVSWRHNIRVWRSSQNANKWRWVLFDLDRGMLDRNNNTLASMISNEPLLKQLVANDEFKAQLGKRFLHHLNNAFQPIEVISLIDSVSNLIAAEMPNHIERWSGQCANGACGISSMSFWQDEVERRRRFARERPDILLQQVSSALGLDNIINISLNVQPSGSGLVTLDGDVQISNQYNGVFIKGNSHVLTAQANKAFQFEGWFYPSDSRQTLIQSGEIWSYWDTKEIPGEDWTALEFDDSFWDAGPAQLGYGDGDEATVIDYGGDGQNKNITYLFRHRFKVDDISGIDALEMSLKRDDGAIVYINGQEVVRSNMPEGSVDETTLAVGATSDENAFRDFSIDKGVLKVGENIIAVEVHQANLTSSDLSFDLQLDASRSTSGENLASTNPEFSISPDEDLSLIAKFTLSEEHKFPSQVDSDMQLTAAGSPFIVDKDVTVNSGATLTIDPGVRMLFATGASIHFQGSLQAIGAKDSPILLEPLSQGERWGGLSFSAVSDTARLSHVIISGATRPGAQSWQSAAISADDSHLRMDHVRILNVNDPFTMHDGSVVMNACELDGLNANDDLLHVVRGYALIQNCYLYGDGEVDFDAVNGSIIRNNVISIQSSNSNQDAFDIGSKSKDILIEGNTISNATDKGISIGERSTAVVRRNTIINCASGVAIKDSSFVEVINNTFFRNDVAINVYEKISGQGGGSVVAVNNIFSECQTGEVQIDEKSNIVVTYSLSNTSKLFGVHNIVGDPLFVDVDNGDFRLMKNSPAIDAGDLASPNDPDETRADIGAYYYDQSPKSFSVVLNEICPNNETIISDPAGEFEDWLELYNGSDQIFDIAGLYLTDDLGNPSKYQIISSEANSTTIPPKGMLIIWLDGDLDQEGLHASFKLNAAGEELGLFYIDAGDTIQIDATQFDAVGSDKSLARLPDGTGDWIISTNPSPGQLNMTTQTAVQSAQLPTEFVLLQNYPNPFNPQTTIRFALPKAASVRIDISDVLGRHVKALDAQNMSSGWHQFSWDGTTTANTPVSAGLYFYSIHAGDFYDVKKMLLVK